MHKFFRRLSRAVTPSKSRDDEYHEKYPRPQSIQDGWRPVTAQSPFAPQSAQWNSWPGVPPQQGFTPAPAPPNDGWGQPTTPVISHYHDHSSFTNSNHFAECAEIWDRHMNKWVVCDPNDMPVFNKQPEWKDEWNYFCVTKRFSDRLSEPRPVLTHFAEPLQRFVVNTCSSFGVWGNTTVTMDGTQTHEIEMGQAFRALKKMKERLEEVREVLASNDKGIKELVAFARSLGHMTVDENTPKTEMQQFLKNLEKQLRVFVGYLDEKFKPTAERLASAIRYGYMEFDLLPYYFERGQEVSIVRPGGDLAMKVTQVNVSESFMTPGESHGFHTVSIEGYGYSWEGSHWGSVTLSERIYSFPGTQELSKLNVRMLTDEKRKELAARGKLYKDLAGVYYRTCNGDRIVIDRSGYLRDQTQMGRSKRERRRRRDSYDDCWYQDAPPPHPCPPPVPMAPPPIASPSSSVESLNGSPWDPTILDDSLLCFLPTEVYGFNLAKKDWAVFSLEAIKPVEYDRRAWDHLVLDAEVKTLIKGLVEVTTKSVAESGALVNDVIARKGGGLTAVLYGPPGTGKTLTAEAVAELLQRPLLVVGSSDLPREPSQMEDKLNYTLSLATSWDAVLLIDEADVFLEQRSLHEIERNALVSAALRVLEYHRGVVFLTTNRIKVFDEAFLSRFSIAIKYPDLNKGGRYLIWSRFLELAGYRIVASPFVTNDDLNEKVIPRKSIEDLAEKCFNGRTIKNLVRTAQALALSSNMSLTMDHIHVVVKAQEKFLEDFASERRN